MQECYYWMIFPADNLYLSAWLTLLIWIYFWRDLEEIVWDAWVIDLKANREITWNIMESYCQHYVAWTYTACTDIRQVCIFTLKPYSSISHNFQFVGCECMSYDINRWLHFDSQINSNWFITIFSFFGCAQLLGNLI